MAKRGDTAPMSKERFTALAKEVAAEAVGSFRVEGLSDSDIERKLGRALPPELKSKQVQVGGFAVRVAGGLVYPVTPGASEPMAIDELRSLSQIMNDAAQKFDERVRAASRIAPFFHEVMQPST